MNDLLAQLFMKPENIEHKSSQHMHANTEQSLREREKQVLLDKFSRCWYSVCVYFNTLALECVYKCFVLQVWCIGLVGREKCVCAWVNFEALFSIKVTDVFLPLLSKSQLTREQILFAVAMERGGGIAENGPNRLYFLWDYSDRVWLIGWSCY